MEVKIREFNVYSDDGSLMHVIEYKGIREIATADGMQKMYGVSRFATTNGETVNFQEGGYQALDQTKVYYELVE